MMDEHNLEAEDTKAKEDGPEALESEAQKLIGQDEILEEIWAIRESIAAEHDYDLERIFKTLREREKRSTREMLESSPKRIGVPGSA